MRLALHEDPPDEKVESAIEWRDRKEALDVLRQESVNPRLGLDEWLTPVVILALISVAFVRLEDPWSRGLIAIVALTTVWNASEVRAQPRALIEYLEAKESLRKWREEHGFPDLD